MLYKKKIIVRDQESVTGLLSYSFKAIMSSRSFLRIFYDLIASVKNAINNNKVRLNTEIKTDVEIWQTIWNKLNGQVFYSERIWSRNTHYNCSLITGATQILISGFLFVMIGLSIHGQTDGAFETLCQTQLYRVNTQCFCLVLVAYDLSDKGVDFRTNNRALVSIINKRTSQNKQIIKLVKAVAFCTTSGLRQCTLRVLITILHMHCLDFRCVFVHQHRWSTSFLQRYQRRSKQLFHTFIILDQWNNQYIVYYKFITEGFLCFMNLIHHIPICNILNYIVHLVQENKRLILLVHVIWYTFFSSKINGWWTCIIKVFIVGLNSPVVNRCLPIT